MVQLMVCNDVVEAHHILNRLQNEGIECFLINERITTLMPYLSSPLASGVQVMVHEDDEEKAREILAQDVQLDE